MEIGDLTTTLEASATSVLPHVASLTSQANFNTPAPADTPLRAPIRVAEVVAALSQALDLSTGQPPGHSIRCCILAMRIAKEIKLPPQAQTDLFYATLLKDAGCSTNASAMFHALQGDEIKAKRDVKTTDWTSTSWETLQYALSHVAKGKPFLARVRALVQLATNQKKHTEHVIKIRCERGAAIARLMGLTEATAQAINCLDEHWDGQGHPDGLKQTEIPIHSRIMLLVQTLEVFLTQHGADAAVQVVNKRSRKWFDPGLIQVVNALAFRGDLWKALDGEAVTKWCLSLEPEQRTLIPGDQVMDNICVAFASIVDAKSPFTFNHSNGVAHAAVAIGRTLGLSRERVLFLRHAALLHDLGKLSVPNTILEKPGKLDATEWESMRLHPFYTWKVLNMVPGLEEITEVTASHHEKLDGTGYYRGLSSSQLSLEARILTVADIFDALSANRPYREGLPLETVFKIMRKDTPHALDVSCVEALAQSGIGSDQTFVDLQNLSDRLRSY